MTERLALAGVLNAAADYIDSHGLQQGAWGRMGGPVCAAAAIAIGLDEQPARLGRFLLIGRTNPVTLKVGSLISESRLLDYLPVPQGTFGSARRKRPGVITPRRAVAELAEWSDAPGRTSDQVAGAFRAHAVSLLAQQQAARQPVVGLQVEDEVPQSGGGAPELVEAGFVGA